MIIFVDIDDTICTHDRDGNYDNAKPLKDNIDRINSLFDDGHKITYWSARGSVTGIDWYEITHKQFKKWGVKYHNLILGEKPAFDLLIDDKVLNINDIRRVNEFIK